MEASYEAAQGCLLYGNKSSQQTVKPSKPPVCVAGLEDIYTAPLHLFYRELFFLFLKKSEQKILLCDTQSHPMAHFPQPQWATCPHRHCLSLADRLTLGICKLQYPATENCSKKYGTILQAKQVIRFGAGMPDVQRRPKQTQVHSFPVTLV